MLLTGSSDKGVGINSLKFLNEQNYQLVLVCMEAFSILNSIRWPLKTSADFEEFF